jgi:hypothetical protein
MSELLYFDVSIRGKDIDDKFPLQFHTVPSVGDKIISSSGKLYNVTAIVWEADNFERAQLKIVVELPQRQVL